MSKQRQALPQLIARCADAHPECGIRLQGSVARGDERVDSDIDLTIVVPAGGLVRENELLSNDNHWRMRRIHDETTATKLDVNWVAADELLALIEQRGAVAWYMFLTGTTLRDPVGVVGLCHEAIARWFEARPAVLDAWKRQQAAVEAWKADRAESPEFPTQTAFVGYLASREHG